MTLQRANRSSSLSQGKIAEIMCQSMNDVLGKPTLKNARQFQKNESSYLSHPDSHRRSVSYAPEIIKAIRTKAYYLERPHINIFGLSSNTSARGHIYIATSMQREGEVKIGFTTMPLEKRAQKFRTRYGYEDFKMSEYALCESPEYLESLIADELYECRSDGNVRNDSIEWYQCDALEVVQLIEKICTIKKINIYEKSWDSTTVHLGPDFSGSPYVALVSTMFKNRLDGLPKCDSTTESLVNMILDSLKPDEAKVLRVCYGLDDGRKKLIVDVARELMVRRSLIKEIRGKALRKCRHPSRSGALWDSLERVNSPKKLV